MYVEPVRRIDKMYRGKPTHYYVDGNGETIPGVTTLIDHGKPKPALVGWGIKSVAEYAVNRWDDLADLPVADRLRELKGSPYAERDAAASRGTEVHGLAERIGRGEEVEVPDELAGHVESAVAFYDEWRPRIILAETTCYNLTFGWAGTLDMVAEFPDGRRALLDFKTSKGVYADTGLQLAAYRYATHYIGDDGEPHPMPEVDWCGVIHVRADGYDVYPIRADEHVLKQMRYVAAVARAVDEMDSWKLPALPAPQPTLDLGVTA